jgi:hypothetical protein
MYSTYQNTVKVDLAAALGADLVESELTEAWAPQGGSTQQAQPAVGSRPKTMNSEADTDYALIQI